MSDTPPTFRLSEPEDFEITVGDSGTVVSVRGELDMLTAPLLWERLEPLLPSIEDRLVIDLAGARFIDSMGLGVL
ncbi:MAG TPA: STAS domain-containing protein, partial [Acidimicrobiia bacterium]|nr:STAS domain-containing protein [Acidimicrobiia bacterium]